VIVVIIEGMTMSLYRLQKSTLNNNNK